MVNPLSEKPPFVAFETRAVEDREASIAEGIYKTKDVDFAIITPQGSKDKIERRVDEWLASLREAARDGRIPETWVQHFTGAYRYYTEGQEMPLNGQSIRNWPILSPSQVRLLIDLHILTIEDLAVSNEETISRLGMGGRDLVNKAQAWLAGKDDKASQLAALQTQNADLTTKLEATLKRLEILEAVQQPAQAKRA